ncbi:MAG TPA: hypothetical protein VMT20_07170 [Terriglobia bacterium]|nr:hypothetical protein [Terriglobia bacterium]
MGEREKTSSFLSGDWKMVARGEDGEDYDLIVGDLIVELSRGVETGRWTFWAVRFAGTEERIGQIDSTMPPAVVKMLDAARNSLIDAVEKGREAPVP